MDIDESFDYIRIPLTALARSPLPTLPVVLVLVVREHPSLTSMGYVGGGGV